MPRKNQPHPSLRRNNGEAPPLQHGDPYEPELDEDDEDELEHEEEQKRDPAEERFARFERELELLRRENDDLRRRVPPANARADAEADEEPDWDELLFKNPKEALKLHGERVRKQVTQELRSEYQRDQGTTEFWRDFYAANSDLKNDDDIVQMVLSANLGKLGGMPVPDAMTELADLTRKRIMAYSNRKGRREGDRTTVEGASAPSRRRAQPESDKVVTLSDIIRNRRAGRRKASSAA